MKNNLVKILATLGLIVAIALVLIGVFGGGKIGQVVQTVVSDTTNTTSSSYADISGMTVAITPVATSSKILVNVSASLGNKSDYSGALKLLRDSTQIAHGDADGSRSRVTFQFHGDDNEND